MSASEIAVRRGTDVAEFDPAKTKQKLAQVDAVIEYAKRIKDWPLLEQAIDLKIEEQEEFVVWWDANVTPRNKGGTRRGK